MKQNNNEKMKEQISIGAILPLSGKASIYGKWIQEALELGKEEINEEGGINGKQLEIIYEDDSANPRKARLAMKKLCQKLKVPIVFGSWASSCVSAQIPIAYKTKTIVLAEAIAPKLKKTGGYVFSIQPSAEYYIKKLVPFVYFDLKVKKVSILYVKNDFGTTQAKVFQTLFENFGGKIISKIGFRQGETNFRGVLKKIKKEKPEALFVPAYTEIVPIIKQAKELNLKVKFIASIPFENPEIIKQLKKSAEGVIYPSHYVPDPKNPEDVKFRKEYKKKYKREPEGFAALAYEGIKIIAKALRNWDGKDRESLKNEFYGLHYFGPTGETIFDETGHPIKKIVIKTVKNGKFVKVKETGEKLYLRYAGKPIFPYSSFRYHSEE
jgi:branched-chain amino acid transport system substrate-binding protein